MNGVRKFLRKRTITSVLVLGVLASVLLIASPAHAVVGTGIGISDGPVPWTVAGVCTGQAATTNGSSLTVVVEGEATSQGPAIDTGIICHLYQNGVRKGTVGGTGIGVAAVAAGTVNGLSLAPYTFCAEVTAVYLTGSARSTCP